MTPDERRLRRHLTITVIVKLAVLGALWGLFVRDAGVKVDADRVAAQIGVATPVQGAPR